MWIVMMICYFVSMVYVVELWVCYYEMIVRDGNYYHWVNACFVYCREMTLNIILLLHWHVVTCIHCVVVVNEKDKLQSEQGGLMTCPEFEQDGFRVRVGWTWFLSEPIDNDIVPHAYESSWSWESRCIIKWWICDCCVC